jgi:hypothetical protein
MLTEVAMSRNFDRRLIASGENPEAIFSDPSAMISGAHLHEESLREVLQQALGALDRWRVHRVHGDG